MKFINFLKGKKTYIIVAIGVANVLTNFGYSDITFIEFVTSPEILKLLEILGIGTIRAGISKL